MRIYGFLLSCAVAVAGCGDIASAPDLAAERAAARQNICDCFMLDQMSCDQLDLSDIPNSSSCLQCVADAPCAQIQDPNLCQLECSVADDPPIISIAGRHVCECLNVELDDPECAAIDSVITDQSDACSDCLAGASCDKIRVDTACLQECDAPQNFRSDSSAEQPNTEEMQ